MPTTKHPVGIQCLPLGVTSACTLGIAPDTMDCNIRVEAEIYAAHTLHTARAANCGPHAWHAWITERTEVGIGETESEAIEHLGRIHAAIDCGFCGKNLTECECPQPM